MTPQELSAALGIIVSLVFTLVPGLRVKFAALDPDNKRAVIAASLLAVTIVAFVGTCANVFNTAIECSKDGALTLLNSFIAAVTSAGAAYLITPKPADVKAVNENK